MKSSSNIQKYGFEPTEKENELFNKQKKDMYKGTFYVCLAYGLSALLLLILGAFTDLGREYIFGKMLPATATFVIGAIFIIIYLSASIYSLKPKQLNTRQDADSRIVCPDYWKLERVPETERQKLANNFNEMKKRLNETGTIESTDSTIQYKCVMDPNVLNKNKIVTNNTLYNNPRYVNGYAVQTPISARSDNNPEYVYVKKGANTYEDTQLQNYAEFSGLYNDPTHAVSEKAQNYVRETYDKDKPLICNTVYPSALSKMESESKDNKKYRCLYAQACDIPWTEAGCQYTPQK